MGENRAPMAVAVINYNTCTHLRALLKTVAAESPTEVVIADNGSQDGSAAMVRAEYPQYTLIENPGNPGYGAAANQVLARCTSPYVLLLNSDTRLQAGALQALSAYLDQHPRAAIAGPQLVNPDGTLQASCFQFPSPQVDFLQTNILGWLASRFPGLRERYLPCWDHDEARMVPWVMGAALAIRRSAFNAVGGFDEAFFMYSEEVDLCYRMHAAGWQIHYAPVIRIVHVGGASTDNHRMEMAVQRYAATRRFYRKHYSPRDLLLLRLIVTYSMLRNLVRDGLRRRISRQAGEQERLAADLAVWKRILREQWQNEAEILKDGWITKQAGSKANQ